MRKWLPAIITLCGYGLSAFVYPHLQDPTPVDLRGLLPFGTPGEPDLVPRAIAAFGLPSLALLVMLLLHEAPVGPLGRVAGRLMGFREASGGRPADYYKFAPSYRIIVSWVVMLVLSVHAAVLASALGWYLEPGTIVGIVLGMGLVLVGNILPRLRPNAVAGIRTRRTMNDPNLWARVHRTYGVTWVILGVGVVVVALTAPRLALIAGLAALLLSSLAALATPGLLATAMIMVGLSAPVAAVPAERERDPLATLQPAVHIPATRPWPGSPRSNRAPSCDRSSTLIASRKVSRPTQIRSSSIRFQRASSYGLDVPPRLASITDHPYRWPARAMPRTIPRTVV